MTTVGRIVNIPAVMSQAEAKILDRRDLPEYVTAIVVIIISLGLYAFIKLTGEVVDGLLSSHTLFAHYLQQPNRRTGGLSNKTSNFPSTSRNSLAPFRQ